MLGVKKALALTLLTLLLLLICRVHLVEVAEANFVPSGPFITIDSPEENRTYATSSVWLNITLLAFYDSDSWNTSRVAEFSLDGEGNITIPVVYECFDEDGFSKVTGSFLLSDLSEGSHSMTVYATYNFLEPWNLFYSNSKPVNFSIDLPEPTPSPESQIESLPSSLVFTASVGTALLAIGLLACFKKRR